MINFVGIANRVAELMGLDRGADSDHSPPIIFMRDTWAMTERFPNKRMEGRDLLGMYYMGMIYLSLPDITESLFAHECVHWFGGDEEKATEIAAKLNS